MKKLAARMENMPSTIVINKNVDGADTKYHTMEGPLENNPLVKCIGVIRIGTYQAASEDSRWAYEPVSALCPDIEPDSDNSYGGSIY